uniref:Neurotransmitter-gated ion-channel ligand-binding domain-containing protein n=1 Tax=Romanomermis culicivorax TaxID=13658 RepID=A0A915ISD7_ROMCU
MEKIERKDLENRKRDELITKILYEMVYFLLLIYLLKMHQIDSKIRHKTETFRNDNLSKTVDEDDSCKQEEKIILQTIFTDYDKTIMPNKSGLEVQVEMHIQDISSLSELTSDFELDVLFSSIWRDPSLSFEQFKTCETNLTLDLGYLNRIWLPKVCVINSKQAE